VFFGFPAFSRFLPLPHFLPSAQVLGKCHTLDFMKPMTFEERSAKGKEILANQPPYTPEQMKASMDKVTEMSKARAEDKKQMTFEDLAIKQGEILSKLPSYTYKQMKESMGKVAEMSKTKAEDKKQRPTTNVK
jgi:hypothetical protein